MGDSTIWTEAVILDKLKTPKDRNGLPVFLIITGILVTFTFYNAFKWSLQLWLVWMNGFAQEPVMTAFGLWMPPSLPLEIESIWSAAFFGNRPPSGFESFPRWFIAVFPAAGTVIVALGCWIFTCFKTKILSGRQRAFFVILISLAFYVMLFIGMTCWIYAGRHVRLYEWEAVRTGLVF
jgi:hypothetical protein